jgi:hypothetical protein
MKTKDRILNGREKERMDDLKERIISLWVVVITMGLGIVILCNLPTDTSKQDAIIVAQGLRIEVLESLNQSHNDSLEIEYIGIQERVINKTK